jgi:hypothetical protein
VRRRLAGRRLVWYGIRGEDGECLSYLPELVGSFSIVAPLRRPEREFEVEVSLENLRGARPDLDRYDIDLDPSDAAQQFWQAMVGAVKTPTVIATYRPSAVVSALSFVAGDTVKVAGPLSERQAPFEHKPWVECALRDRGVVGLKWHYVAESDQGLIEELASRAPQVLRAGQTSGGVGLTLVRSPKEVAGSWPERAERFVAVAPFVEGLPVNFSGCVFDDGTVRLHPPSLQLIGVRQCTNRPFGYCGNDFAAIAGALGRRELDALDEMGRKIGSWLHEERYRGAFGVDAIIADGEPLFTEMNPRFQGSSVLSARIATELEVPDLFLDHLMATLGLSAASPGPSLFEWAVRQPSLSRVVIHNDSDREVCATAEGFSRPAEVEISQSPGHLPVEPGGSLGCLTLGRSVTVDGFGLDPATADLARRLRRSFAPVSPLSGLPEPA